RERCLPSSVVGPVLICALRRFAPICLNEVIGGPPRRSASFCHSAPQGPLREAPLLYSPPAPGHYRPGPSAKASAALESDRRSAAASIQARPRRDAARGGAGGRPGP